MTQHYDSLIIGTGQAGCAFSERLSKAGQSVALIERAHLGGTCVNVGCIPTKTLVASARVAHMARRAQEFGVTLGGDVGVDLKAVKARMKRIVGDSNQSVERWLTGLEGVDLIRGEASFAGPNEVRVNDQTLTADHIYINVGARPSVPKLEGLDQIEYLDSTSILELETLPEHLIVVGGSYIGLEYGQMYRRFGSQVTILEKGERLIPRDDEDVSHAVREILEDEGITVRCQSECMRFRQDGDQIAVQVDCDGDEPEVRGSHVLLAVGRTPNTDALHLDAAGIETDERGYIPVNDQLQTNVPGIWALGDCNGKGAFTHTAYNDYEIAAANRLDQDPRRVSDRILCYGLYIDPPLGRVGKTETQVRESGRQVLVSKLPMKKVGRAKERSETQGFLKVFVDADSKHILGAAFLGINADEVVQTLLPAMYGQLPYTVIARAVPIHPTVAELLPTLFQGLEPLE